MTAAPGTTPSPIRIKVQSDLNQQPQWLLIPKSAKSVQDLVKSLVVRLELPDSSYELCLDGAPILPNEDVALVRDGEHLHLRPRQPPRPHSPQLNEPHEPQPLHVCSELDDIRYETQHKRKRVLTPDGKRRRNARNRKREKRRRLERRESPGKRDPSIPSSQPDDPNPARDTVAPNTGNDTEIPDPSSRYKPRESPDKSGSSIPDSQHDDINAAEDAVTPHASKDTALLDSSLRNESPHPLGKSGPTVPNSQHEDPTVSDGKVVGHTSKDQAVLDSSSRKELQSVSANIAAPSHVAKPCLPSPDCEKALVDPPALALPVERLQPERKQSEPPKDQTRCVLKTSAEGTAPPNPLICDQLPKLKSDEQKKSSESHGEGIVPKETANKDTALHDEDVLAQKSRRNVDMSSTAEALQSEVNDSGNTRHEEVTVNISFVNEVVDVLNEDTFIANSAVDIENKSVEHEHSSCGSGHIQMQSLNEFESALVSQTDRRDTLNNVKPRWKRQRLQGNDSIRGQPDLPSPPVGCTKSEEPHLGDTSVTNDGPHGPKTHGNPGHDADAQKTQEERTESKRPPPGVINLEDVEEDCAHASDRSKGPYQSVSANSSKSSSPQSIVVSPAEPRNAVLPKGGFSTLRALQVARKAGLLAAEKQKDDIGNKPATTAEDGGKLRKKSKRRKRSKSGMRYLTEEQINKSTFIGLRPETMLPPLELLDLPEGADELRRAVDVSETLVKTSKRSRPEASSQGQKNAEITSEPNDKMEGMEGTSLAATGGTNATLLNDNQSESARQEKSQTAEEQRSSSRLKDSQSETRASEGKRHGMRSEIVAHDPPESQRTTKLNNESTPLRTGDNFQEDLVLMLRQTSKTLAEVWAKWDDCQ